MLIERMLNFGAIFCDHGSGDSDADNGTKVPSKIVGKKKNIAIKIILLQIHRVI